VTRLRLTLASAEYDHFLDLTRGRVVPAGIDLVHLELSVETIFDRFLRLREWEISEMSFAKYCTLAASGDTSMVALPVFPLRAFRHSSLYVRDDSALEDPAALSGLVVGVPEWAQTAGVYVRGILEREYGVDLTSIRWVQAGVNEAGRSEKVSFQLPPGIDYIRRPDATLNQMLLDGEVDAIVSAHPPAAFGQGVRRLLRDPKAAELASWRSTGVHPIMHVVVVRRDVVEEAPWVPLSLYTAFAEARRRSLERAANVTVSPYLVPWWSEDAARLAGEQSDVSPYGIEPNRATLSSFLADGRRQGLWAAALAPEDLFDPELERTSRV